MTDGDEVNTRLPTFGRMQYDWLVIATSELQALTRMVKGEAACENAYNARGTISCIDLTAVGTKISAHYIPRPLPNIANNAYLVNDVALRNDRTATTDYFFGHVMIDFFRS